MSKKQHYVRMKAHSFYRLMRAIKNYELENDAISIGNIAVSDYLALQSNYKISKESIKDEVKIHILETAGEENPEPDQLSNETKMSEFEFTNKQNIALTYKLNIVIKDNNPSASQLSVNDIKSFKTVLACINAVISAIG